MAKTLKDYIKEKRSGLSQQSINTYSSVLKGVYKLLTGKTISNDDDIDFSLFDDFEKVFNCIKDLPINRRKTILSALVVITDNPLYKKNMLDDIKEYNKEISKQEMTDTQKENWLSQEELRETFNHFKKSADFLYKKNDLSMSDLQEIQNFIIIAVYHLIPPRRSKDFTEFKIKNITPDSNYMEKDQFVFNDYKTAKFYKTQKIVIPKALQTIIKKWIKVNPTDYLLFDNNMNKLSPVKLNQRLNKIFNGKRIAVNALRHSYLTDKYANEMKIKKQMENDFEKMGSSTQQADTYIKLD